MLWRDYAEYVPNNRVWCATRKRRVARALLFGAGSAALLIGGLRWLVF